MDRPSGQKPGRLFAVRPIWAAASGLKPLVSNSWLVSIAAVVESWAFAPALKFVADYCQLLGSAFKVLACHWRSRWKERNLLLGAGKLLMSEIHAFRRKKTKADPLVCVS